jgi:hypothetical protein
VGYGTGWSPPQSTVSQTPGGGGGGSLPLNEGPFKTIQSSVIVSPYAVQPADNGLILLNDLAAPYLFNLPEIVASAPGPAQVKVGQRLVINIENFGGAAQVLPFAGQLLGFPGGTGINLIGNTTLVLCAQILLGGLAFVWVIESCDGGDSFVAPVSGAVLVPGETVSMGNIVIPGYRRNIRRVWGQLDAPVTHGTVGFSFASAHSPLQIGAVAGSSLVDPYLLTANGDYQSPDGANGCSLQEIIVLASADLQGPSLAWFGMDLW